MISYRNINLLLYHKMRKEVVLNIFIVLQKQCDLISPFTFKFKWIQMKCNRAFMSYRVCVQPIIVKQSALATRECCYKTFNGFAD